MKKDCYQKTLFNDIDTIKLSQLKYMFYEH